jgi:hypothetical protein
MVKNTLTDLVFSEWDVARRTAEFFDGTLGNLRTFGLTASVTLIGIAFEFHIYPLLIAIVALNLALIFIDRRYQAYLKVTAKYAMSIEEKYGFSNSGLTFAINEEREKHKRTRPEHLFQVIYAILALAGVAILILYVMGIKIA